MVLQCEFQPLSHNQQSLNSSQLLLQNDVLE